MKASMRKLALMLCLGSLPIGAGCMFDLAGGSTSTETGDKVSLTGRVIGGGGEPVAGARVTLMRAGLFDITNAQGYYELIGTSDAEPATTSTPDTLNVEVYGQHVLKRTVTSWVGGLSGVRVVQRGFWGMLLPHGFVIAYLEGVVTGDGIAPGDSISTTFFHNTVAGNYSGFVFFPPPDSILRNYTLHVNVYDSHGHLVGRSDTVFFNSLSGNVTIPPFDPENLAQAAGAP
jgi:hypothetical protein